MRLPNAFANDKLQGRKKAAEMSAALAP
ncbi:MAG: hypothetical protein RJA39_1415, partial [Pseudomonadota bacterium]